MTIKIIFGAQVHAALEIERDKLPRSKRVPGCWESGSLCAWQASVHGRGFRDAELVPSVFGWSVRSGSGLDNFALLAGSRCGQLDGSREDAERWARDWQAEDAERRYVWMCCARDLPDSEYDRDNGEGLVSSGGECIGCGRIMSVRERNEQGVCDGCAEGSRK